MAGIHLHTHDLVDEGPERIRGLLHQMDDLEYLFVQVNTIFERNPSPVGTLEHNPRSDVIVGTGTLHADIRTSAISPRLHQVTEHNTDNPEADPLAIVQRSHLNDEYTVVPWLNIVNGSWEGAVGANCIVDFTGTAAPHWLCPNGTDVVEMWARTIVALHDRYGYATYLIDRIRFPDWAGRELEPRSILSCFCENCTRLMGNHGIDVEKLRATMHSLAELMRTGAFEDAVSLFETPQFVDWIRFRQRSVTDMVSGLIERVGELNPQIVLWLDTWPPAYAWLLGQDYETLTALSPALKHFPYHRLGGGADVQGLIEHFASTKPEKEAAFRAFKRLFRLEYELSYADFVEHGFPIDFVADQNRLVRELSTRDLHLFSGVQMWNLPPHELLEATVATYRSGADVIYYCYGWASESLFGASNGAMAAAGTQ